MSGEDEPLPIRMLRRERDHLRSENERLRLIVDTIVPEAGGFDPESQEQTERIALEWTARYWQLRNRIRDLEQ